MVIAANYYRLGGLKQHKSFFHNSGIWKSKTNST